MAARMNCLCCGNTVALKDNKAKKPYYYCGFCDISVQSKGATSADILNEKVGLKRPVINEHASAGETPAPAQKPAPALAASKPPAAKPQGFRTLLG